MVIKFVPSSFKDEWDKEIRNWTANPYVLKGRRMAAFQGLPDLRYEYIPEPYYGDPDSCSAVVININPGCSTPVEFTKSIINVNMPCTMMYDFCHVINRVYSRFQKKYNPFTCDYSIVPGVDWWRDNRVGYIEWLIKEVGMLKDQPIERIDRTPFALELCPFHSKSALNFSWMKYQSTILRNVIEPAICGIHTSMLPFGLGFTKVLCNVLLGCGFQIIRQWQSGNRTVVYMALTDADSDITINGVNISGIKVPAPAGCKFGKISRYGFLITWQQGSMIKFTENVMKRDRVFDESILRDLHTLGVF